MNTESTRKFASALDARKVAIIALAGQGSEQEENANDLVSMMLGILAEEAEEMLDSIEATDRVLWAKANRLRNRCDALHLFFNDFIDAKHSGVTP